MKIIHLFIYSILLFLSFSCVTLFWGSTQEIIVTSKPSGAKVIINGKNTTYITPCKLTLNRNVNVTPFNKKNEYCFTFKKEGYRDTLLYEKSKFNWLSLVDYSIFIIPGLIDYAVGADRMYPSFLNISLTNLEKTITPQINKNYTFLRNSDVDKDIPKKELVKYERFALIIGNEDYTSYQIGLSTESNVDFARNDASAFYEYALKTLGIPEQNILFLLDATSGQINQSITKLNLIIKNCNENADVFVYYAGHGLPDEETKEAYIIPVDISGVNTNQGVKLKDLYAKLTEFPSKRITIFLDACFSGGARNQELIATRGVKIKAKENRLNGNLVVFTSSSETQSSLPYKAQQHGLFTYFLLKHLKETNGETTYNELSEYLKEKIPLQSVLLNNKEQTPQTNVSTDIAEYWKNYSIK